MRTGTWMAVGLSCLVAAGCATPGLEARRTAAAPAMAELQKGGFDAALRSTEGSIATDANNPYARLVRAIVRYKKAMHAFALDVRTAILGLDAGGMNHKFLRASLAGAEAELARVDEDLAVAAREPGISLELCLACWEIDWNGNGRIDRGDRMLMQIEQDAKGETIPPDDPRRKPTFRFDHGDVVWARAFVAVQRALIDVVLAFDWMPVEAFLLDKHKGADDAKVVIPLADRGRIATAKKLLLDAIRRSDECRRAYLAETDDDREWVPNPRQKSHPMPLPVDEKLYATWEGVLGDLERLVNGDEGLAVSDLLQLTDRRGRPRGGNGFIDVGRMLSDPKDIVIEVDQAQKVEHLRDLDAALPAIFGRYYVKSMKPSPLPGRLLRMKGEMERDEESFERKLRYLLWLN